ncbi:hypothetical protein DICPUDRAFT_13980, partial [Dictyostelium purpureum]
IVDLSTTTPEGSVTGSTIISNVIGSKNVVGIPASLNTISGLFLLKSSSES